LASAKVTTKSFIPFGKHGCQGLGELKKFSPKEKGEKEREKKRRNIWKKEKKKKEERKKERKKKKMKSRNKEGEKKEKKTHSTNPVWYIGIHVSKLWIGIKHISL
jgi:hypothetical protein